VDPVLVFGALVSTDRVLPGLPVAETSDGHSLMWELVSMSDDVAFGSHSVGASVLGALAYSNNVIVSLAHTRDGDEIVVSDTGRFELPAAGRTIRHSAPDSVDRSAVALDLIGVVLPYLFHRAGAWCLHASAVQTPTGAIAFVATQGTGKSTLAAACVAAGCALVADDVVVLRERGHEVDVTPAGIPLRLREATAREVGEVTSDADAWGKVRVAAALARDVLPLRAVYVLQPMTADAPVERSLRAPRAAAIAVLANGKITELLGSAAAGDALARCASIAQRVPVYDLAVPRDLGTIGTVVDALLSWHSESHASLHDAAR
jgi:hypothetical protein